MKPVELYSSWCYIDYLDGKELKEGERVLIQWPDGLFQSAVCCTDVKYQSSHEGEIRHQFVYINVPSHGVNARVYLRQDGVLVERDGA